MTHGGPLLVLLIGGRLQPAAMLAVAMRPRAYGLVGPKGNPMLLSEAERILRSVLPGARYVGSHEVDPFLPEESASAVQSLFGQDSATPGAVSLIGAPLPMALGAYEMARTCGLQALYLNTHEGEILDLCVPGRRRIRLKVGIEPFLTLHGAKLRMGAPSSFRTAEPDILATADLLGRSGEATEDLMRRFRQGGIVAAPGFRHLLDELVRVGILKAVGGRFEPSDSAARQWLNGVWLEHFVECQAREARTPTGQPIFDQVRQGLQVDLGGALRELDFVGLRAGTVVVGSCKTRGTLDKADLDEVAAVASHLGGDYCTRVFFTHLRRGPRPSAWARFEAQARRNRVVLVSGEDLPRSAEILAREALAPTYVRK